MIKEETAEELRNRLELRDERIGDHPQQAKLFHPAGVDVLGDGCA